MLTIRNEQRAALRAPLVDALAARVDALLRRGFAEAAALAPEARRARTRAAIERGLGFGLATDRELALYATADWVFGERLAALALADGDFLREPALRGAQKAARLRALLEGEGDAS